MELLIYGHTHTHTHTHPHIYIILLFVKMCSNGEISYKYFVILSSAHFLYVKKNTGKIIHIIIRILGARGGAVG
jgi:hypothetical protein